MKIDQNLRNSEQVSVLFRYTKNLQSILNTIWEHLEGKVRISTGALSLPTHLNFIPVFWLY